MEWNGMKIAYLFFKLWCFAGWCYLPADGDDDDYNADDDTTTKCKPTN